MDTVLKGNENAKAVSRNCLGHGGVDGAGVTSGGCTISLNGTLTPGTITADVLIGTAGATDKPLATNYSDNFSANALVRGLVGNL